MTTTVDAAAGVDADLARLVDTLGGISDGDLHRARFGGGWTVAQVDLAHQRVARWSGWATCAASRPIPSCGSSSARRSGTTRSATRRPPSRSRWRQLASTRRTLATCLPAMATRAARPHRRDPRPRHDDHRGVDADDHRPPHQPRRAGLTTSCATGASCEGGGPHRARSQVAVEDRPEPEARPGWVVVQVESASLCGTDSHQYDGRIDTPFPRVPGHDFAGRVESVGDGVDDGTRRRAGGGQAVAAVRGLPGVPARASSLDCQKKKLMGLWSDGCMTEKVAVPRVNLDPAARGRRGVAGVAAGADRGRAQHRRPAADRARRDGDRARARARSGWRSPGCARSRAPAG